MIKTLNKLGIEGNYLNLRKGIYEKSTITSYLMVKEWKFAQNYQNKKRTYALTISIQHVLEVLASAIRQEKEVKAIWIEKLEVKLSL